MIEGHSSSSAPVKEARRLPTEPRYASRPMTAPGREPELIVHEEPDGDAAQRGAGLKSIVSGAILIAIGFAFGGSVFLGNPGPLDWFFDGLGTFWVCKGIYQAVTA